MWVSEMDIADDVIVAFNQDMEQVEGKTVLAAAVGQRSRNVRKLVKVRAPNRAKLTRLTCQSSGAILPF